MHLALTSLDEGLWCFWCSFHEIINRYAIDGQLIFFNLPTTFVGYNLPRQISTSIAISTASAQRFQPVSSATTSFTSSQLVSQLKSEFWVYLMILQPQVTSTTIPSPVLPSTSQATPSSTSNSQQSTPISLVRTISGIRIAICIYVLCVCSYLTLRRQV